MAKSKAKKSAPKQVHGVVWPTILAYSIAIGVFNDRIPPMRGYVYE